MRSAFWLVLLVVGSAHVVSAQSDCITSADCNGGTCGVIPTTSAVECRQCPGDQRGLLCEQPSNIILSSNCTSSCGTGRCLLNAAGKPVCADTGASMPTAFLPSIKLPNNATYGPYVCGVTAPCTFSKALAVYTPVGVCGTDYTLTMFGNNPYNPTSKKCGASGQTADVCLKGPFLNDRVFQVTTSTYSTGAFYSSSPKTMLVQCSKIGTYLQAQYPNLAGTHSALLLSYYGITASGPGPMCADIPGQCATGTCVRQTGDYQIVDVTGTGVWRTVPSRDICCPRGKIGNQCEIESGCTVSGCINGGTCTTVDKFGKVLKIGDTRCFGCNTATNSTPGYQGVRCEDITPPTFVAVSASGTPVSRRLLQSTDALARNPLGYTSTSAGVVYKEPSRVCDCGVTWNGPYPVPVGMRLMQMGNIPALPNADVLLSPVQYDPIASYYVPFYYTQTVNTLDQAKYLCYKMWSCAGVIYNNVTNSFQALARVLPPFKISSLSVTSFARANTLYYNITRVTNPATCPNSTLDPVFYCNTYPLQCQAIRNQGGVGNVIAVQNSPVSLVAWLHFEAFGHLIRNKPNAQCDLTTNLAEDEQGCSEALRAPKVFYALAPGEQLTAAICGNSSRIDPERVTFGPLLPGVTGTNTTNGMDAVCQCNPPFRAADTSLYQDCSYDLCGIVDGRGKVNATYANALDSMSHFNHSNPAACVCYSPWGTDPASCVTGNTCNWCSATSCQNGGTASPGNFSECSCNEIFTGDRCEVSLCNATNTYPFNYTLWVAAGEVAEEIVCDCRPGWTGQFCNDPQCVNGQFNYELGVCDCAEGYISQTGISDTCDVAICDPTKGSFVPAHYETRAFATSNTYYLGGNLTVTNTTTAYMDVYIADGCDCQAPWTGPRCQQHTCDDYNIVQTLVPDFDGVRPFGVPQLTENNDATWECGCTWPYVPQDTSAGRPLDCAAHDCNWGYPNANASNVVDPVSACTCQQSAAGLFTEDAGCTSFSHNGCPNACLRGSCGLSSAEMALVGSVEIGDSPTCCRCNAAQGYNINGECQQFCAFYQPCLTTALSAFTLNPNYNASLPTSTYCAPSVSSCDAGISRVAGGNDQYICECKSGCVDYILNGIVQPCSNCTYNTRDGGNPPNTIDYGNALVPPVPDDTVTSSSDSSSSGLSSTAVIALAAGGGLVVLLVVASLVQAFLAAPEAATAASVAVGDVAAQSLLHVQPPGTTTTVRTETVTTTTRGSGRGTSQVAVLFFIGMAVGLTQCAAADEGFVYPLTNHWDTWYMNGSDGTARIAMSMAPGEVLLPAPAGGKTTWGCDNNWPLQVGIQNCVVPGCPSNWEQLLSNCLLDRVRFTHLDSTYYRGVVFDTQFAASPLLPGAQAFSGFQQAAHLYGSTAHVTAGRLTLQPLQYDVSISTYGNQDPQEKNNPSSAGALVMTVDTFANLQTVGCGTTGTPVTRWLDTPDGSLVTTATNAQIGSGACPNYTPVQVVGYDSSATTYVGGDAAFTTSAITALCAGNYDHTFYYQVYRTQALYIRGCRCNNGLYGTTCSSSCPAPSALNTPSPFCTMRGKCKTTNPSITSTFANLGVKYCSCDGGCTCPAGFNNTRCETAVFTNTAPDSKEFAAYPNLVDFSECCPANHPNCAPIVSRMTGRVSTPTKFCTSIYGCMPNLGFAGERQWIYSPPLPAQFDDSYRAVEGANWTTIQNYVVISSDAQSITYDSTRPIGGAYAVVAAPFQCGKGINTSVAGWIPTTGYNAGHGQCDLGMTGIQYFYEKGFASDGTVQPANLAANQIPAGRGFCWCNNPVITLTNTNTYHGWWTPSGGTACGTRTCTMTWPNARSLDSNGNAFTAPSRTSQTYVGLAGAQCSNRSAVVFSDTSSNTDPVALNNAPCNDTAAVSTDGKTITRINTPGYCKQCIDGWGFHAGYSPASLAKLPASLGINSSYLGICDTATLVASNGGAPCGGYGLATTKTVVVSGVILNYTSSCYCPAATWQPVGVTQPAANGGLCQRSCAGDASVLPNTTSFSVRPAFDALGNFIGNSSASVYYNSSVIARCGGYKRGLCRPIADPAWGGGWNSACMCNPGFNGPQCDPQPELYFNGTLCGPDGEFVLQQPGVSTTLSADEYYFNKYIVPLNNLTALNSKVYSAYKCQCKAAQKALNYVPNANGICGLGCASPALVGNGLSCSGNGQCVDDPRTDGNKTAGKVCMCKLGWDGTNCIRPNLRDSLVVNKTTGLGQVCGGAMDSEGEDGVTPRGVIVYQDSTNLTQKCLCKAPYKPNPSLGPANALCWKDCFSNCTDALHGACVRNVTTGNDNNCICSSGAFFGQSCSKKLLAVYNTQSGSQMACSGHGLPGSDNLGYCVCDADYVGSACEIYQPNRQCGTGQTFMDTESVGIKVS